MANRSGKSSKKLTDVVADLVDLLTPLSAEDRQKAIIAARTLLGDSPSVSTGGTIGKLDETSADNDGLSSRAVAWMRQNNVSTAELQQVFHFSDEGVEVIAKVPGKSDKERTHNAYVLAALGQFLKTGNALIDDKSARALCVSAGCFNKANHARYMDDHGKELTGSKEKGWRLTTPGLTHGAKLIQEINKEPK